MSPAQLNTIEEILNIPHRMSIKESVNCLFATYHDTGLSSPANCFLLSSISTATCEYHWLTCSTPGLLSNQESVNSAASEWMRAK